MLNAQFPDPKHASFSLDINCYLIGIFYFAELIVWLSFQFQDSLEIAKLNDLKYLEGKIKNWKWNRLIARAFPAVSKNVINYGTGQNENWTLFIIGMDFRSLIL